MTAFDQLLRQGWDYEDLTGREFTDLTVLFPVGQKRSMTFWACRCRCGEFVPAVATHNLLSGHSRSCGSGACQRRLRKVE